MIYTKITVSNYRCFTKEVELHLAKPITNSPGSGITYIVGANNSGKTTLIESIWTKKGDYLNDSEKQTKPPVFKFHDESHLVRTVTLPRINASVFIEDQDNRGEYDLFEIISSRRHWDSTAHGISSSSNIIKQSEGGKSARKQQDVQTSLYLKAIETDEKKYNEFTSLVKKVIPEFNDWSVGYENTNYIKYHSSEGVSHKTDFLGDGVISIIRIIAHLYEGRSSGLIIDEPELSLHPMAQKRLLKLIATYAEKRQIIISTHSPYFINWEYLKNGAILNRVRKTGDSTSEIFTIRDDNGKYEKLLNGDNWQQPFLMDVVSKELFFQDNILFVEGQEDIGLLRQHFNDTDINLFGYGVRGYQNFEFALKLADDLGIMKACALIDSPIDDTQTNNENVVKQRLEDNYKKYKVVQLDTTDIRDKTIKMHVLIGEPYDHTKPESENIIKKIAEDHYKSKKKKFDNKHINDKNNPRIIEVEIPEKSGYFDMNGELKQSERDAFLKKIEEVRKYFNPQE